MKKFIYLLCGCLCAFLLVACSNQKITSGKNDIYQVKVTKTGTDDVDNWTVKGTTSAPDGSKILAVGKNADPKSNAASNGSFTEWSRVHNGQFTAHIDPTDAADLDIQKGQKCKVYLFAITNYHKDSFDDEVPKRILNTVKGKFDPISLTATSKQAESPDDDDSDDVDSPDSSDSSTAKYPHYKSNKKVASAINDDFSSTGDDKYENTHVQYRDSIFYVSVPNSVTASPSAQQQSFFETVARTIHSYQKRPTGVIYFEDQQGNILAKTKALHNNEVKMK